MTALHTPGPWKLSRVKRGSVMAAEQPLDVLNLVGEEVAAVAAHPHGWSIRFGSGAGIVIPKGVALDSVGVPVIEP